MFVWVVEGGDEASPGALEVRRVVEGQVVQQRGVRRPGRVGGWRRVLRARGRREDETRRQPQEAGSGVEALDIVEELGGKIDIVVSDVVMPEMDGPTLLRELRKEYPDLKFIFVSGYAEDAFAKNLDENEKFSFLPKPFSLKQLAGAVKEAMKS